MWGRDGGRGGYPVPESDSCSGGRQGHRENEEGCRAGEARRGGSGESLRQAERDEAMAEQRAARGGKHCADLRRFCSLTECKAWTSPCALISTWQIAENPNNLSFGDFFLRLPEGETVGSLGEKGGGTCWDTPPLCCEGLWVAVSVWLALVGDDE